MGRKRDCDGQPKFADWWTVNVLGAHAGAEIRGIRESDTGLRSGITSLTYSSVAGVKLKVVSGAVLPYQSQRQFARDVWDKEGQEGWAAKLGAKFGVSTVQAQQLIDQFEPPYAEPGNREGLLGWTAARPGGGAPQRIDGRDPLTVRILEVGAWRRSPQIVDWVKSGEAVTTGQIAAELDRTQKLSQEAVCPGFLALRPHLWVQGSSTGRVEPKDDDVVYSNVTKILCGANHPEEHYDVETHGGQTKRIVMPPSGTELTMDEVQTIVLEEVEYLLSDACKYKVRDGERRETMVGMLGNMDPNTARVYVEASFGVLSGPKVGFGALKSCFQKMARVQANVVDIPLPPQGYPQITRVDGRILVMVALAIAFTSRGGGFVPDIGLYVRGQVAALKRLGVTMVEDAWPERPMLNGLPGVTLEERDPGVVLAALLAAATVCVQVTDYYVPKTVIKSALHVMAASLHSSNVIAWRPNIVGAEVAGRAIKAEMGKAATLLRTLVSFKSDMAMFEQVAGMETLKSSILIKANPNDIGGVVPLKHLIDQHVYRGVAHTLLEFPTLQGADDTIANRFKLIFNRVTGFSPRLAGHLLDEKEPIVSAVRYAESVVQVNVFPGLKRMRWGGKLAETGMPPTTEMTNKVALDYGVLSAGVGTIGTIRFKTTAEENANDSFFPGGQHADHNWSLLVILPVEKPGEIVINFVSAHANDNSKKPPPTPTAKRRAIERAQAMSPYKFSSPMMPGYTLVHHVGKGSYKVTGPGKADVMWSFDAPNKMPVAYTQVETTETLDLQNNKRVLAWVKEVSPPDMGPLMLKDWQTMLREAVRSLPPDVDWQKALLRMMSMLKQQYVLVAMPTPGLKGEMGSDQMKVQAEDPLVWRMLLAASRACPGALTPKQVPMFKVEDARLLRLVEKEVATMVDDAAAGAGGSMAHWAQVSQKMRKHWETPDNKEPFDYQTALVNTMLRRDGEAVVKTQGHFVSLETGMGKSFVGLNYAVQYGAQRNGVETIVWVTPMAVIDTFVEEATKSWGTTVLRVDRTTPVFERNAINIVGFEWFSNGAARGTLETKFLKAARNAFFVFDEVHNMYSAAIRNSTMREAALLCTKFVCMTATPIGSPSQPYALDWLKDTVGFPVSRDNQLVAAAMMAAARVELPIESKEVLVEFDLPSADLQRHTQLLQSGRNWAAASSLCLDASQSQLVQTAIAEAQLDRTTTSGGGCLLVLDSQERLVEAFTMINAGTATHKIRAEPRTICNADDPSIGIILVTKGDVTGYNLVRMGSIVTGVYASNAAKRHQLRGRIRRVGQVRDAVRYVTVVPKFTILELLHRRHNSVDKANESLAQLADEFCKNVERFK